MQAQFPFEQLQLLIPLLELQQELQFLWQSQVPSLEQQHQQISSSIVLL